MTGAAGADGFWNGRPVLITGGQGFIGCWVTEALLDRRAEVVAVIRDEPANSRFAIEGMGARVTRVRADLRDMAELLRIVNEYSIEAVFHLAAQTIVGTAHRSPLSTFETNIRGTYNLLEACRLAGSVNRVVVASSDKAYGAHEKLPYAESAPLQPTFPYDVSKACTDLIARSYFSTYGLPVAVTRLANVYGGGDFNFSRIIPETARALIEDRRPVLRSDATPQRDFIYAEDAASAYVAIGEALDRDDVAGRAFNAGAGSPISVKEVVAKLIAVSGKHIEPDVRGKGAPPGEIDRQFLDSRLIRDTLGWKPQWDLEDGLRATYRWYEQNLDRLPAVPASPR
jgi:CDP-glucose 4,6-dehydratase